jgi:hypothetical protein
LSHTDTLAAVGNIAWEPDDVVTAQDQAFGVMRLTLRPGSYAWDYQPALAGPGFDPATALNYRDSGTANCRGVSDSIIRVSNQRASPRQ